MHSVHEFEERDQVQSHKDKQNLTLSSILLIVFQIIADIFPFLEKKLVSTNFLEQIVFFLSKSVWTSFIFLIMFDIIVKGMNAHIERVEF